jgi:hypothetical protein
MREFVDQSELENVRDPIGEMLAALGDHMRQYDAVCEARGWLSEERVQHEASLSEIEEGDLEGLPDAYVAELGRSALGLYLVDQKLSVVGRKLTEIAQASESIDTRGLLGKKVGVFSNDPERYTLGTSRKNQYGQYDGLSKWYPNRHGVVTDINTHPGQGGWMRISARSGRFYSATPLVDRHNDYQPAFTIEATR